MNAVRVLLADDHQVLGEGLRSLLQREAGFEVVGMARDGRELLAAIPKARPELVITDLAMPGMNGIEAIRAIVSEYPAIRVLCLSMHAEPRFVEEALAAGAAGYVLKEFAFEDLNRAIEAVLRGQVFICPQAARVLADSWRKMRATRSASAYEALSSREREVLQLLAEGHSTAEIAERLHVSVKTVGSHREHIMRKTGLSSVADLTKYAVAEGLTSLQPTRRADADGD